MLENPDAIVLLAVINAGDRGKNNVAIGDLISAFDCIEHPIVTFDEFRLVVKTEYNKIPYLA